MAVLSAAWWGHPLADEKVAWLVAKKVALRVDHLAEQWVYC